MRSDDDPEKQRMKGQVEVKHEILEKYLSPWLHKITETSPKVRYIDGFAGWGRYDDGSPGSPIIGMNVAKRLIEEKHGRLSKKLDTLDCIFVENKSSNFSDLESEVASAYLDCPGQIEVDCKNMEFEEFAIDFIKQEADDPLPAFIFVDPFGFSGLPFGIIQDLLNLRGTGIEVFVTFVDGEMARFLENDDHADAITEILGTDRWQQDINMNLPKEKKVDELLRIYEEQLRQEAGVRFVWPFRMSRESKSETVYHLVHATNHFDGFKLMKDIMFRAGAGEEFAYLGPNHYPYFDEQQNLNDFTNETDREVELRVENLANYLHERLTTGTSWTFRNIIEETYMETLLIEKHYRDAIYLLEDQNRASIINHPDAPNGTAEGLNDDDEIIFKKTTTLGDY